MRMKIDTLERERDFYFDKLREIEILCQNKDVASTPVRRCPCTFLYLHFHIPSMPIRSKEELFNIITMMLTD